MSEDRLPSRRVRQGKVDKSDHRSADYPLTPTPRTTLRTSPAYYPNLRLRGKETQEAYQLRLHEKPRVF